MICFVCEMCVIDVGYYVKLRPLFFVVPISVLYRSLVFFLVLTLSSLFLVFIL